MRESGILRASARRRTSRVNQCLILAAGNGSRLIRASGGSPKPLVQLHGQSLLEHVILGAQEAGIDKFVIVVGYGAGTMREWLAGCRLGDISIDVVENRVYHKDNGVSVLKASQLIHSPFLLLMADHIFEPRTARALLEEPLAPGEVILAVDPKLDRIFDLDDATKVKRDGDHIVDIGKLIADYDAYDTGMFLCSPFLFDVLESVKKEGNCSLSDGMRALGRQGRLRAFDIEDGVWQDVDTPEALAYAESIFEQRFCRTYARVTPMSKSATIRQNALRAAVAVSGMALLARLISRVGTARLLENISALGWGLALIVALGGVVHFVKTWAWRLTLTDCRDDVSFTRMLQFRLVSEAAGQAGALGLMLGEGLRVSALGDKIPIDSRISSVTLDRAMFIASGAIVSIVGVVAALLLMPLPHALRLYAIMFTGILLSLLSIASMAMLNRWPFVSRSARVFCRWTFLRYRIEAKLPLIHSVENKLFNFHRHTPGLFWASLALNLTSHAMAILEVYLILLLMGIKIGLMGALVFEALTKLVNAVGALNPGNIGSYEGGNMLIAKMFGLSGVVGLSIALTRRVRAIFWTAVGGLCLFLLSKSKAHRNSGESLSAGIMTTPESAMDSQEASPRLTSIIFANTSQGSAEVGSSLMQVGALPILLRNILSVQKTAGSRIIVCVDPATRSHLQSELIGTGRLPYSVWWLETPSDMPMSQLLKRIASRSYDDHMLLVAGNSVYSPALFRQAKEWSKNSGALTMTDNEQPTGSRLEH